MRRLVLLGVGLLLALAPLAPDTFTFSADSLEAELAEGRERTVLSGNARLVSEQFVITAAVIELYGEDSNVAICRGQVHVEDTENDTTLTCDRLVYNRREETIRLEGGAVMEDRSNEIVIKGEIIESREKEGEVLIQVAVRILKEDLVSRSELARYWREENRLELSGMPQVRWKGDRYSAARIRIDLDEDRIELEGDVEAEVSYQGEETESEEDGGGQEGE